jgi:hypothetical protein
MRQALGVSILGVVGLCAVLGMSRPAQRKPVPFDVVMVTGGARTLRVTAPNGKRLVVVEDDVTVSEIPDVEATVTRVDDVTEESAGPAGTQIQMTHPMSGVWRIEMSTRRRSGISLTASAEGDSVCDVGDGMVLEANSSRIWRLEIATKAGDKGCVLSLRRVDATKPKKS